MANEAIVKLRLEASEYDKKLREERKAHQEFEKSLKSATAPMAAFAAGLASMETALKVTKDALMSFESTVDDWGAMIQQASGIYNSFVANLNNADFSGFLTNINNVMKAAQDTYKAIDDLNTKGGILSNAEKKLNADRAEALSIIKNPKASAAEKERARKRIEELQKQRASATKETMDYNNNVIRSMLREQLIGKNGLSENEFQAIYGDAVRSLYYTDAYEKTKGITFRRNRSATIGDDASTDLGETYYLKLSDMLTDEFRESLRPYIASYYGAKERRYTDERAENRLLGSGKTKGAKLTTIKTPKVNEIKDDIPGVPSTTIDMANGGAMSTAYSLYKKDNPMMLSATRNFIAHARMDMASIGEDPTFEQILAKQNEGSLDKVKVGLNDVAKGVSAGGALVGGIGNLITQLGGNSRALQGLTTILGIVSTVVQTATAAVQVGSILGLIPSKAFQGGLVGMVEDGTIGGGVELTAKLSGEDIYLSNRNYMRKNGK